MIFVTHLVLLETLHTDSTYTNALQALLQYEQLLT